MTRRDQRERERERESYDIIDGREAVPW